jgi:hypothetical protein
MMMVRGGWTIEDRQGLMRAVKVWFLLARLPARLAANAAALSREIPRVQRANSKQEVFQHPLAKYSFS